MSFETVKDIAKDFQNWTSYPSIIRMYQDKMEKEKNTEVKRAYAVIIRSHLAEARTAWMDVESKNFALMKELESIIE
jgi:hypothetical protein